MFEPIEQTDEVAESDFPHTDMAKVDSVTGEVSELEIEPTKENLKFLLDKHNELIRAHNELARSYEHLREVVNTAYREDRI